MRSIHASNVPPDPSLHGRVERAEGIYKGVLEQRDALIKKFGPSPAQVVMYVSLLFAMSIPFARSGL